MNLSEIQILQIWMLGAPTRLSAMPPYVTRCPHLDYHHLWVRLQNLNRILTDAAQHKSGQQPSSAR